MDGAAAVGAPLLCDSFFASENSAIAVTDVLVTGLTLAVLSLLGANLELSILLMCSSFSINRLLEQDDVNFQRYMKTLSKF